MNFAVMDVKRRGSVQKGLVPVISSCTHCFPAEALPALTLGRHDGAGRGGGVLWKTVEGDLSPFQGSTTHRVLNRVQKMG